MQRDQHIPVWLPSLWWAPPGPRGAGPGGGRFLFFSPVGVAGEKGKTKNANQKNGLSLKNPPYSQGA